MFDVISIGDSTIDVFLQIDHATLLCDIHHEECKLCFNYSDKIPVSGVERIAGGGNAANHAFGISRLGLNVAIYTTVGNDQNGRDITSSFKNENVFTKYIQVDVEKNTNYSTVLDYKGQRTILSFHEKRNYIWPKLKAAKWIFFSSIFSECEETQNQILNYLDKYEARLAFSPGTHQLKLGLPILKKLLEKTSLLFLNKEEAWSMLGKRKSINETLLSLYRLGPKAVIITDGSRGSYCYDGVHIYQQKVFKGPVVEMTGAGDAYASAFVGAVISGRTIIDAMRWGTINSAMVLRFIGGRAGLQSREQIEKVLAKHTDFRPKVLL